MLYSAIEKYHSPNDLAANGSAAQSNDSYIIYDLSENDRVMIARHAQCSHHHVATFTTPLHKGIE